MKTKYILRIKQKGNKLWRIVGVGTKTAIINSATKYLNQGYVVMIEKSEVVK